MSATTISQQDTALNLACARAKDDSLANLPTAVYQVDEARYVVSSLPLADARLVGVWCNGVQDGRFLSLFK